MYPLKEYFRTFSSKQMADDAAQEEGFTNYKVEPKTTNIPVAFPMGGQTWQPHVTYHLYYEPTVS